MALTQCASLQDRFCVFDTRENNTTGTTTPWKTSIANFKDSIGINALNYGACYTPWLISSYSKDIDFNFFNTHVKDNTNAHNDVNLELISSNPDFNDLSFFLLITTLSIIHLFISILFY